MAHIRNELRNFMKLISLEGWNTRNASYDQVRFQRFRLFVPGDIGNCCYQMENTINAISSRKNFNRFGEKLATPVSRKQ